MSYYKTPGSDERRAFEDWLKESHYPACTARTRHGYISEATRVAWRAWQARAELAKQEAAA